MGRRARGARAAREPTFLTRQLRDRDVDRIRLWFETRAGAVLSKHNVVDAVRIVADRNAFHPVRDYLDGLSWDGVPRADRWLEDFAGEAWHLGAGEGALMDDETEARALGDPWEERLAAWTSARATPEGEPPFTMEEVLSSALGLQVSNRNARVTSRASRLLGGLGYERRRRNTVPRSYHYVRVGAPVSHCPTWRQLISPRRST